MARRGARPLGVHDRTWDIPVEMPSMKFCFGFNHINFDLNNMVLLPEGTLHKNQNVVVLGFSSGKQDESLKSWCSYQRQRQAFGSGREHVTYDSCKVINRTIIGRWRPIEIPEDLISVFSRTPSIKQTEPRPRPNSNCLARGEKLFFVSPGRLKNQT